MSASLLEGLATARPVVVYDHGHYSELPDDSVIKVDPAAGPERLREAVEALVTDPERAARVGRRGRSHLDTAHAVGQYADALAFAAQDALISRPLVHAVRRTRGQLVATGLADHRVARDAIARTVSRLFSDPQNEVSPHRR